MAIQGLDAWDDLTEGQGESIEDLVPRISSKLDQVTWDRRLYVQEKCQCLHLDTNQHARHRPFNDGATAESGPYMPSH